MDIEKMGFQDAQSAGNSVDLRSISESDLFKAHTHAFIEFYLDDENQELMKKYTKKNGKTHKQRYMNELIRLFRLKYPKIYLNKAWIDTLLNKELYLDEDGVYSFSDHSIDIEKFCTCKSYYMEVKHK
jgi:hypothetical protein